MAEGHLPATDGEKKRKADRQAQAGAARLAAVQTVYQMMASSCGVEDAARIYLDRFAGMDLDGEKLVPPDRALYTGIVRGVSDRTEALKALMDGHLTASAGPSGHTAAASDENGRRIDPLLQSILLCGLHEILTRTETDLAVIVSEYLHVTRAFYDGRETALVHAVLDAAGKTLRSGES